MVDKKEKKIIIEFNPSARYPVTIDRADLDYINEAIREAGMKIAEQQDKDILILLMSIIRKKLREDPTFAPQLKKILGKDAKLLGLPKRQVKLKKTKYDPQRKTLEYELGC